MIGNIHRFDRPGPHITLMGATNRALTFRARGGGCFAPQISGWNDSDGEPLALVFAQEHGAGLEAWQTRTRRRDSDSVNTGLNPQPGILLKSLCICSFLARRNSLETSAR